MIVIVDYDTGNLRSVENALKRITDDYCISSDKETIMKADKLILPGVGEASSAMAKLAERGLDKVIPTLKMPVLGICIGVQLMCKHSQEGDVDCMGIFDTDVRRFDTEWKEERIKIPHMGWNSIENLDSELFKGLKEGDFVYYVHSFAPDICGQTIASTSYGGRCFSAALQKDNFYGTQFHPEKSGDVGEIIIRNFVNL